VCVRVCDERERKRRKRRKRRESVCERVTGSVMKEKRGRRRVYVRGSVMKGKR
jgi:hypothetical protein